MMTHSKAYDNHPEEPKESFGHKIAAAIFGHSDEPASQQKIGTTQNMDDPLKVAHTGTNTASEYPRDGLDHSSAPISGDHGPGIADKISSKLPGHQSSTSGVSRTNDPLLGANTATYTPGAHATTATTHTTDHGLIQPTSAYAASRAQEEQQAQGANTADYPSSASTNTYTTDRGLNQPTSAYAASGMQQEHQGPGIIDNIKNKLPGHHEHSDSHPPQSSTTTGVSRTNDPLQGANTAFYPSGASSTTTERGSNPSFTTGGHRGDHGQPGVVDKIKDKLPGHHTELNSHQKSGTAHNMDDPLPTPHTKLNSHQKSGTAHNMDDPLPAPHAGTSYTTGEYEYPSKTTDHGLDHSTAAHTSGDGLADKIKSKLPGHQDHSDAHHHQSSTTSGGVFRANDPLQGSHTAVHAPGAHTTTIYTADRGLNQPSSAYATTGNTHEQHQQGQGVADKIKSKLPGHDDHSAPQHHQSSATSGVHRDNDPLSANYTGATHNKDHALKHTDNFAGPHTTDSHKDQEHDDLSFMDKLKNKLPDSMRSHHNKADPNYKADPNHTTTETSAHNTHSQTGVSIGGYPTTNSAGHTQDQQTALQ